MVVRHKDESGRPAYNRGKPPHKHGYHGRMKGCNAKKVWFEKALTDRIAGPIAKTSTPNKGKTWKYVGLKKGLK